MGQSGQSRRDTARLAAKATRANALRSKRARSRADGAVAVLGGGKMGADIAAVLAAHGWDTHVHEPDAAVRASLPQRVGAALGTLKSNRRAANNVHAYG